MLGYFLKYMIPKSPFYAFLSIRCVNYCKILHVQQRFRDTRNFDEIILNFAREKKMEFRENFAKINDFISRNLAKLKIISSKFRVSRNC